MALDVGEIMSIASAVGWSCSCCWWWCCDHVHVASSSVSIGGDDDYDDAAAAAAADDDDDDDDTIHLQYTSSDVPNTFSRLNCRFVYCLIQVIFQSRDRLLTGLLIRDH